MQLVKKEEGKDENQAIKIISTWLNGSLNCRQPSFNASIKTLLHQFKFVQNLCEDLTKERDKIRSDLSIANERSAALAVEIDEQNAEQEKILASKIEVFFITF